MARTDDRTENRVAAVLRAVGAVDAATLSKILGRVIAAAPCGPLALEWTADRYWAGRMPGLLNTLDAVHARLVSAGVTEARKVVFNDLDDAVWYEPSAADKVLVHTTQSRNFLYVWPKDRSPGLRELHVRFFYDRFDDPRFARTSDRFEREEDRAFKAAVARAGRAAVAGVGGWVTAYADDAAAFPERPSLDACRRADFRPRYGDARDPGYVLSWQEAFDKVDRAVASHHWLDLIVGYYAPNFETELFGEEAR